jgi:flagellar hook-length control protein FliK
VSSAAPTGGTAAPAARPTAAEQAALSRQLGGPVAKLAEAGPGERSVLVRVSPDTYGPVTVRATIGADGSVRVELASATDTGREALRAGLADLRRDLAQVLGANAQLSVDPRTEQGRSGAFGQGTFGQGTFGQGTFGQGPGQGAPRGDEAGVGTGQSGAGQAGTGQNSAGQNGTGQHKTGHNGPGGVLPRDMGARGAAGHTADGPAGAVLHGTAGLDVLA